MWVMPRADTTSTARWPQKNPAAAVAAAVAAAAAESDAADSSETRAGRGDMLEGVALPVGGALLVLLLFAPGVSVSDESRPARRRARAMAGDDMATPV